MTNCGADLRREPRHTRRSMNGNTTSVEAHSRLRRAAPCGQLPADEGGRLKLQLVTALMVLVGAPVAAETKILFLAGPRDHGMPGRHEYERDLRTLAQSFERAANLSGVRTQVLVGSLPR